MKKCPGCGVDFEPRRNNAGLSLQKFCSRECGNKNHTKKTEKKCVGCKEMFMPRYFGSRYCSLKCGSAAMAKSRVGKKNPAYTTGQRVNNKRGLYTSLHAAACVKYRKAFIDKHGYVFCEICGVNSAFKFEVHHIYFASLYPRHANLHDFRNLVMVCIQCHNNFHAGKKYQEHFQRLEKDRGLKELFAD